MPDSPLPPNPAFKLGPDEPNQIEEFSRKSRHAKAKRWRDLKGNLPKFKEYEYADSAIFIEALKRAINEKYGATNSREPGRLLRIGNSEPGLTLYPFLSELLEAWDAAPENHFKADNVRAQLLSEMRKEHLFRTLPSVHGASGLLQWMLEPSEFADAEVLSKVCSTLSLHGSEALFRQYMTLYETWSPFWKDAEFNIKIGCEIAGYCITNGQYGEAVELCNYMREVLVPRLDDPMAVEDWIDTIRKVELNAACNMYEEADHRFWLDRYAEFVTRTETLYAQRKSKERLKLHTSACRGYVRAVYKSLLTSKLLQRSWHFNEECVEKCGQFLIKLCGPHAKVHDRYSYDEFLNNDSRIRYRIIESEARLRGIGHFATIRSIPTIKQDLEKERVKVTVDLKNMSDLEPIGPIFRNAKDEFLQLTKSATQSWRINANVKVESFDFCLYFFAVSTLTSVALSCQLARIERVIDSGPDRVDKELAQARTAMQSFSDRVGLSKVHHNRELYRILATWYGKEKMLNASKRSPYYGS